MEIRFIGAVKEFILTLDKPSQAKVFKTVELLTEFGSNLGLPHSKSLGGGLLELRIRGKVDIRIFYGFYKGKCFLLHGIKKKSQALPPRDVNLARQYLRDLTH